MSPKPDMPNLLIQKYGEGHRQGWNDALQHLVDWLRRRELPEGDIRRTIGSDLRRAMVSAFREYLAYPGPTLTSKTDVHFGLRLSGHDDGNTNAICGVLLYTFEDSQTRRAFSTTRIEEVTCPHCRSQLAIIGREYGEARRVKRVAW